MTSKNSHVHDGGQCCECGNTHHCCCDCPRFVHDGPPSSDALKAKSGWKFTHRNNEMNPLHLTMTFDSEAGVVYIYNRGRQSQKGVVVKTLEAEDYDNVYLDYDKDGKIFGIEILNPGKIALMEVLKLLDAAK